MMTDKPSILPHNATPLERTLEQSSARIADVPTPLKQLWDPQACPLELLPWLAWALSTDRWETHWSEAQKRQTVAEAIDLQRKKGTPASVETVIESFDTLMRLVEWFEMVPVGVPHTFDIIMPLVGEGGGLGGFRSSAEFVEAIVRDVTRTKPARSHFRLVQLLESASEISLNGAGWIGGFVRLDCEADMTIEPEWAGYLQTENGEPIQDESGEFIQEADL